MTLSGNHRPTRQWEASAAFFKKQRAAFVDSRTGESSEIRWDFSSARSGALPFRVLTCSMEGFGCVSQGCGDGFFLKNAMVRSFAEAWEWLWVRRLSREQPESGISSSNGFAAGITEEVALLRSREELIERALLLNAWRTKAGWQPLLHSENWRGRLIRLYLEGLGYSVQLFELKDHNLGGVFVAVARHPELGAVVDATYARDSGRSTLKLLSNVLRNVMSRKRQELEVLPEKASPMDHFYFYQNPKHLDAFQFLDGRMSGERALSHGDEIDSKVVVGLSDFPAVARSQNKYWPELTWGKASIQGGNEWPHPIG